MSAAALLDRLEAVKATGPGRWVARCPAHEDRSPSLSIREIDDRVLIHCFAGCAAADVLAAVGFRLSDLFENRQPFEVPPKHTRVPLRDLIPLLRHEAHIVALVGADILSSRTIDGDSWNRLAEATRRIEGVSCELG
jgi:hypothetical protein